MFSKFKNIFYSIKSKFFQDCFTILRVVFAGILFKVKSARFIGMVAILLPCLIYVGLLFGGQVVSEELKGFQVAVDMSKPQEFAKIAAASEVPDVGIVSQKDDFGKKGIPENGSGFIELADIINSHYNALWGGDR